MGNRNFPWLSGKVLFGHVLVPRDEHLLHVQAREIMDEDMPELHRRFESLSRKAAALEEEKEGYVRIDPFMGDPEPKDRAVRAAYVARVAGFHRDVLGPKLRQMIGRLYRLLEDPKASRDDDLAAKGSVYLARELLLWGDRMTGEQVANERGEDK